MDNGPTTPSTGHYPIMRRTRLSLPSLYPNSLPSSPGLRTRGPILETADEVEEEYDELEKEMVQRDQELMAKCTAVLKRISAYENQIARLQHDVEHKIVSWNGLLESFEETFEEIDGRAQKQSDLIQSTTQELSLALSENIPQAEERMLRYRSQLDQVHPIMRESKKTHKEAIETMKHLLNRFEEERKVMVTVATYRQQCYFSLAAVVVAVFVSLVLWWKNRWESMDPPLTR